MISGGNATVYVSDMDVGVRFYGEKLGRTEGAYGVAPHRGVKITAAASR